MDGCIRYDDTEIYTLKIRDRQPSVTLIKHTIDEIYYVKEHLFRIETRVYYTLKMFANF